MRAGRKKALIIVGGVAALIVLTLSVVLLSFDINYYRSKIESAVSETTGLDVKIEGKMRLSFFPFGISAKNIHATDKGVEVLFLERLKLQAELIPLLNKHLKITACELIKPSVIIIKDTGGKFNFEITEKKSTEGRQGTAFNLNELYLSKGTLVYLDLNTGEKTQLKEIDLVIKDLSVTDTKGGIAKNASFTGTMECKEILQDNLMILNIKASMKAVKGIYSFQRLGIGSIVRVDQNTGEKTQLKEIDLVIKDLSVTDTKGGIAKNASFTGTMECKEIRGGELKVDNIKSAIKTEKGIFHLKGLTMDIFGGKGEGGLTADKSGSVGKYRIDLNVSKLDFEELGESFGIKRLASGKGDLAASLTVEEKKGRKLISGTSGTLSLRGSNLTTHTVDLDEVLSAYETSQKFNLVDVGVFLMTGPLGSLALKGYQYGDVYHQSRVGGGSIVQLASHWKIQNGVAEARDCALATRRHRIALKGKLDLARERFDNVTVALLDDSGCAKFKQSVSGPFSAPRIGVVSAVESFAGQILGLFRQTKRLVLGSKCEVFYSGSVRQPR